MNSLAIVENKKIATMIIKEIWMYQYDFNLKTQKQIPKIGLSHNPFSFIQFLLGIPKPKDLRREFILTLITTIFA